MARTKGNGIIKSHSLYKVNFASALAVSALLSGCSFNPAGVVNAVNPVNLYKSAVNYFKGDDLENPKESSEQVNQNGPKSKGGKEFSASNTKFPALSRVDQQQDYALAREKGGLVADVQGRKYAPSIARQGEAATRLAAAPPEPPKNSVNAPLPEKTAKPSAATRQVAAVTTKEVAPRPGLPTTAEQRAFEMRLRKQLAEIRARASEQGPALQAMDVGSRVFLAADNFGTVVISSNGIEAGTQPKPSAIAVKPSAMALPLSSTVNSGGLSYLEREPRPVAPEAVKIATIQFDNGSTKLSQGDQQILANVRQLQRERGGRIHIVGHASSRTRALDPVRHKMINFRVSVDRANAVARELIRLGSKKNQLSVDAVSDTAPLYYEVMPMGEAGNRRAEIYLES